MLKKKNLKNITINNKSSYTVILECWYIHEHKGAKFLTVLVIHDQTSWPNHLIGKKISFLKKFVSKPAIILPI